MSRVILSRRFRLIVKKIAHEIIFYLIDIVVFLFISDKFRRFILKTLLRSWSSVVLGENLHRCGKDVQCGVAVRGDPSGQGDTGDQAESGSDQNVDILVGQGCQTMQDQGAEDQPGQGDGKQDQGGDGHGALTLLEPDMLADLGIHCIADAQNPRRGRAAPLPGRSAGASRASCRGLHLDLGQRPLAGENHARQGCARAVAMVLPRVTGTLPK